MTTAESEVPPREARWTAEPVVASSAGEIDNASRSGVLTVPGRGLFDLDPTIGWNLTLEAEGAWSPGASTQPGQETAKLLLFPTVEIHGDLHREESDAPPERLEARFRSIEKNGGSPKLEGATPCLLDPGASA